MKDMGQSARETLAPQINEPHQPAVSNSEQGAHTPGPWSVGLSLVRQTLFVESNDTWICGELGNPNTPLGGGEAEANARLIAAAPDLLAAAKLALAVIGGNEARDALAAAIRRAEGQS